MPIPSCEWPLCRAWAGSGQLTGREVWGSISLSCIPCSPFGPQNGREGQGREHLESCTAHLMAPICLGQVWGMAVGNLCFILWCSCSLRVAEKLPEANLLLKQLLSLLQHTGHNAG